MSEFIRTRSDWDKNKSRPANYPEVPAPLEVGTYDNHTHLEIADGENPVTLEQHLDLMKQANMLGAVQVGVTLESSIWSAQTAAKEPMLLAAVALHPNEAPVVDDLEKDLKIIEELASNPRVRAIGETGLDFFRTEAALQEKQRYSFKRHIKMAKDHNKALVIHDRDSHQAVLDLLAEEGAPSNTIFHCFSGDVAMAKECIANKYYLSFAGTVTFKNAPELRQAAALVPLDQILVETDSPFLSPMPNRGSLNTPAQIPNTLRVLADVRGESVEYLAAAISENAERIFGKF